MFDRDKKNGPNAGEASLIDTDMRITGSVTSVGDIVLVGSVDGEIKCRNLFVEDKAVLSDRRDHEKRIRLLLWGGIVDGGAVDAHLLHRHFARLTCAPCD